jgi:hypothetical protein
LIAYHCSPLLPRGQFDPALAFQIFSRLGDLCAVRLHSNHFLIEPLQIDPLKTTLFVQAFFN